jgi:hypothetical protein
MNKIIALWSIPRSLSTVVERVFMERGDFEVYHEPFAYSFRQEQKSLNIPHLHEVEGLPKTYAGTKEMILRAARDKPVFFKDMPHCYEQLIKDQELFPKIDHTFLIREPDKATISFWRLYPGFQRHEMLYEQMFKLFRAVADSKDGKIPVVIDGDDFQGDPEGIMKAYCKALGIAHLSKALSWKAGSKKEWETFKEWHVDVASSQGIQKDMEKFDESVFDKDKKQLKAHYEYYLPFFEAMYRQRLKSSKK